MANVGDKYIIEIAEIYASSYRNAALTEDQIKAPTYLYRMKGFNSLVFDENGLSKLEKYEESPFTQEDCDRARKEGYEQGLNDAWEAAMKIVLEKPNGGLSPNELIMIFGLDGICSVFSNNTAAEAISKIKAYEQKQAGEEIKANDEIYSEMTNTKALVVFVDSWGRWQCLSDNGFFPIDDEQKKYWVKTGRQFDIGGILKTMREE